MTFAVIFMENLSSEFISLSRIRALVDNQKSFTQPHVHDPTHTTVKDIHLISKHNTYIHANIRGKAYDDNISYDQLMQDIIESVKCSNYLYFITGDSNDSSSRKMITYIRLDVQTARTAASSVWEAARWWRETFSVSFALSDSPASSCRVTSGPIRTASHWKTAVSWRTLATAAPGWASPTPTFAWSPTARCTVVATRAPLACCIAANSCWKG